MPRSGVRRCAGTVLAALHLFRFPVRRTPTDKPLHAIATEARPIVEINWTIASLECSGIRAMALSTFKHKEFRQFPSPFLHMDHDRASEVRVETCFGLCKREAIWGKRIRRTQTRRLSGQRTTLGAANGRETQAQTQRRSGVLGEGGRVGNVRKPRHWCAY
jgi:hypothetical protein